MKKASSEESGPSRSRSQSSIEGLRRKDDDQGKDKIKTKSKRSQSKREKSTPSKRKGKGKDKESDKPKDEVLPFSVTRVSTDYDVSVLADFMTNCLLNDERWTYLVPEEDKRPKVFSRKPV